MPIPSDFLQSDAVRGVDVFHGNGDIDWVKVRACGQVNPGDPGVQFCYIKATEGLTFVDMHHRANLQGSLAAGLYAGSYHYFHPNDDAAAQAAAFLAQMPTPGAGLPPKLLPGMLRPALDVEVTGGLPPDEIAIRIQAWLDAVEAVLKVKPILYTSEGFWDVGLGAHAADFAEYFGWIAHFTDEVPPNAPDVPTGFDLWAFWQFSDRGVVDGVVGPCDLIRFRSTLNDLLPFVTPKPPPDGEGTAPAGV